MVSQSGLLVPAEPKMPFKKVNLTDVMQCNMSIQQREFFFSQGMHICGLVSATLWIFNNASDCTKLISPQGVTFFQAWAPKSNFSLINDLSEEPPRIRPGPGDGQTYSSRRSDVCRCSSAVIIAKCLPQCYKRSGLLNPLIQYHASKDLSW